LEAVLPITRREALQEKARRASFNDFGVFFRLHEPKTPYYYGEHTKELIKQLDKTTKMVEEGKSRFLCVCIPPRHGKSDVCSRRWPAWHMIRNPDHEFIITSYGYNLASSMSYDCRELLKKTAGLYGIIPKQDRRALESWKISNHYGAVHSAGLAGVITGRGADVMVIDDYYKNREEAESLTIREKVWHSFESDLMTRRAAVSAVVIVANRWKTDDLVGILKEKSNPSSDFYDPLFPKFEIIEFPIQHPETEEFLFLEKFSKEWYETTKALLGSYAWASQGMQNPIIKGGNRFKVGAGHIRYHNDLNDFPKDLRWVRFWDLASTEKSRNKENPDYTVGGLVAVQKVGKLEHVWIKDLKRGRWNAPKRNEIIIKTAEDDGPGVTVATESVGGYKDTYHIIKNALRGLRIVKKVTVSQDKGIRAEPLEPIFEAGNVHLMTAGWNSVLVSEFSAFPNGMFDDIVDTISGAYKECSKRIATKINRESLGI